MPACVGGDQTNAAARLSRPRGVLRLLFRAPTVLYRVGLGWLLGHRLVLLTHRGRQTGRIRRTVVEVVRYDRATKACVVASAWGLQSDWCRNIKKTPALLVEIGHDRYVPAQRFLTREETVAELRDYQRRHPRAARAIGRYLGVAFDGTEASLDALVAALPMVSFWPIATSAATRSTEQCSARSREGVGLV